MKLNTSIRKRFRVSNKVKNVASNDRYRLSISRSSKNISAQIIDDMKKRLVPVIIDYLNNKIKPQTQSIDTLPKISSKRSIRDCLINWEQKTSFIERFIRALLPPQAPGAFTIFKNKKLITTIGFKISSDPSTE